MTTLVGTGCPHVYRADARAHALAARPLPAVPDWVGIDRTFEADDAVALERASAAAPCTVVSTAFSLFVPACRACEGR